MHNETKANYHWTKESCRNNKQPGNVYIILQESSRNNVKHRIEKV